MNKALWLQEQEGQKIFTAMDWTGKMTSGKKGESFFGAPPFCTMQMGMQGNAEIVQIPAMPLSAKQFSKTCDPPRQGRRFFSAAFCSLFTFFATLFAAIGLIQIMISSLRFQPYVPNSFSPGEAAHKPGAGPSPRDAVDNEYQHALTREMVAATDTSRKSLTSQPEISGMLGGIKISEQKMAAKDKKEPASRTLKILNSTKSTLDKVIVQIDILTKSGSLLRTENHTVNNMAPLETQVIELSAILPGAQIHCFVQEVKSKALHTSLRSL